MELRQATCSDIEVLMRIFDGAKKIMRESGNLTQWDGMYPTREVVMSDISGGYCHVLCDGDEIIGTMALIPGPEPTYEVIEGEWPNEDPYYVIHRIAAPVPGRNVAEAMLDWAFGHIATNGCRTIRIDTHSDNCIMRHVLDKYGFVQCGIIWLDDGAPRDAYIKSKQES